MGTRLTPEVTGEATATPSDSGAATPPICKGLEIVRRMGDNDACLAAETILSRYAEGLQVTGQVSIVEATHASPLLSRHAHGDVVGEPNQFASFMSGIVIEFSVAVKVESTHYRVDITIRKVGGEGLKELYQRLRATEKN